MFRRALFALPLLTLSALAPAQAQNCDTRFNFHNRSSRTVTEIYFDRSSNPNWTRDELGADVLPSGRSRAFRAAYSGLYDFKAVFETGQSLELRQVDICRITDVTVTDRGMSAQ